MRSLLFVLDMMCLLPVAMARPFVGVLLWDWIAFMNPHRIVWGFGVNWPWALASFVVTIIGWMFSKEPKRIAINPTTVLMMLFMVGITVNMQFAMSPWPAEHEGWLQSIKMFLVFIITTSMLTDKRRIDALIWMIVISLGFWVAYQGGASVITLGAHKAVGPPASMISDNNAFATALLVVLPLMNYLRLQARHRAVRTALLFAMGLTLLTVLASYSRGAFLALFAVSVVLWWRSRSKLAGLVVFGAALCAAILFMPQDWVARMHSIGHYKTDADAESRLYIWGVAWKLALRHPLTGVGYHATDYAGVINTVVPGGMRLEIHDIWLQCLGEQGFVVFSFWLGIIAVGVINARRVAALAQGQTHLAWARDLARMVEVAIVGYAAGGTFLPIAYWDVFFTVLVALAATRTLVARELAANTEATAPPPWRARRGLVSARAAPNRPTLVEGGTPAR